MKKLYHLSTLLVLLSLVAVPFTTSAQSPSREGRLSDRLETIEARIDERLRGLNERLQEFKVNEIIVKFEGETRPRRIVSETESLETLLASYKDQAGVEYAEPNYIATAFFVPNDPLYQYQWNFDNVVNGGVHSQAAWDVTNGSGVTVAVIDTGVAYENYQQSLWQKHYRAPDLAGTTFVAGYDFVNNDTHANDDDGHGTHVAGTIAGTTNNNDGVSGLAYGAKIMPIKVLDQNGSGTYYDVAEGIRFAADNGAKVINLSLGGSSGATYLEDALRYAYEKGVTIVAASGNNGSGSVSYPAAYNAYVIAVGATRFDENRVAYSNYGSALDIVAPGGDTSVDQNGDGYGDGIMQQTFGGSGSSFNYYFYQGTSMATPHVAAAAALVIANGASSPSAVRSKLESTADDLGASGRDNFYGHGLLNLAAAVGASEIPVPEPEPEPEPEPAPEVTVLTESFESGLSAWTQDSQNDWFQSSQRATAGSKSAEVDGAATDAQLISSAVNLAGKTNAKITFSWFIESALDSGEYIAFDVSTNNGSSWSELGRLRGNVDSENVWHSVSIEQTGLSNLKLRYRGKISSSNEDANVDNIKVVAY